MENYLKLLKLKIFKFFLKDPLIIVGMHRSGTSILSKLVTEAGFFGGINLSSNNESFFIQSINRLMLDEYLCSWIYVKNFPYKTYSNNTKKINFIKSIFFNYSPSLFFDNVLPINKQWHFKDPRSSLTLGIYQKIFPSSKIIYIYRNPVDVINSLLCRELRKNFKMSKSNREAFILNSIDAWDLYNKSAIYWIKKNRSSSIKIDYDELVSNPPVIVKSLLNFIGSRYNPKFAKMISRKKNIHNVLTKSEKNLIEKKMKDFKSFNFLINQRK